MPSETMNAVLVNYAKNILKDTCIVFLSPRRVPEVELAIEFSTRSLYYCYFGNSYLIYTYLHL
ncbi:hypothetical protein Avbf_05696 [Armadillidium vulgare]|nr:hypothetical protein Avbf_05696 [Armadillidium vulgare]